MLPSGVLPPSRVACRRGAIISLLNKWMNNVQGTGRWPLSCYRNRDCYGEDMEWRYNLLKKPEARLSDHKDEDLIGSWAPSSESFESHYWRYRSYWLRWLFTVIIGGIKRELCIARWEGNVEDVQKIEGGREGGWSERQRRRGRGSVIKEEKKGKRWGGKKAEEKRR